MCDLAFAWGLALVCCTHHLGHLLHSLGLHQFAHTGGWAGGCWGGEDNFTGQRVAGETSLGRGAERGEGGAAGAAASIPLAHRPHPTLARPPPTDFMHALGNPWVSGVLGAAALLGPGRPLLVEGALSLFRCAAQGPTELGRAGMQGGAQASAVACATLQCDASLHAAASHPPFYPFLPPPSCCVPPPPPPHPPTAGATPT